MERKLMGPASSSTGLKNNRNILNDEESNSLSSSSIHATSPIQLYGNPGKENNNNLLYHNH